MGDTIEHEVVPLENVAGGGLKIRKGNEKKSKKKKKYTPLKSNITYSSGNDTKEATR